MEKEEKLYTYRQITTADILREAAVSYGMQKQQGEFTVEDYYHFPDDMRMELIDGVIYAMAAPTVIHQMIASKIGRKIEDYIQKRKGLCIVLSLPLDTQLDQDNKTMLQPDVFVLCDRDKLRERSIFGAPDFVAEILSPSTRKKDLTIKLRKYRRARVREYWIVDPDRKLVYVYEFESRDFPVIYTFEDIVPVGIFGGECQVDFAEIYQDIEFLYVSRDEKTSANGDL